MTATELGVPAPRLSAGQRLRLGMEILSAYLAVRRLSSRERLPAVVESLRAAPGAAESSPLPDPRVDGVRLGRAVIRTLVLTPGGTKCLMRSLVLLRLLARRGSGGELIIAVLPGPAVLDAHAWVELDGRPLLPPGEEHERLLVL